MRKDTERGAVVIEATLSLTAFVFTLFTILMLVNIFYIQAKISVALNSAAKEISQYSYLYYKLGINDWESEMHEENEEARETAMQTIDGIGSLMNSMSEAQNSIETADFDNLIDAINNGSDNIDSLISMYANKFADDPKGFIIGMGKLAGEELEGELKTLLGQVLAKTFMKKNLMAYKGDDPDAFLKRYRVVGGMEGLNFNYTSLMANGTSNQVQLVVTYQVRVIRLLNIDFTLTFRQCAKTTAWGNGISLIDPKKSTPSALSVWDNPSAMERGKIIVLEEKKNYDYTDSGHGYDAYDNSNGANEFISIISINTHDASYSTAGGIKNRLSSAYRDLRDKVSNLGEQINVQDGNGNTVTLDSDPNTRTYRIVLVVPDDADMDIINQAIAEFEATGVVVEVRTGYGSPTPVTPKEEES